MNTTTTTQPTQTQPQPQQQPPSPPPAPAPKKELSAQGQLVVQRKNRIQSMAPEFARLMGDHKAADRFVRTTLTAIQMNPQIAEATEQSVINACMKAATDGLILDGREAALTLYNTNKGTKENPKWVKEAQYIPMVTGIIKRVRNSGEIALLNAFVVHENDHFKRRLGLEMSLEHEPNDDNPGKVKGAYAVCKYKDGEVDYEYMPLVLLEGIRMRSKTPDKGPWKTDFEEMCRKTVLRRLSKRLPMSSELRNVIQRVDDLYDLDQDAPTTEVVDGKTGDVLETASPPKRAYKKRQGAATEKMAEAAAQQEQNPAATQQTQHPGPGETVVDGEYEEVQEGGEQSPTEDLI